MSGKRPWSLAGRSECIICGNPETERHHVFFGTANRRLSEEYGYTVPLCKWHHTGPHGVHFNRPLDDSIKEEAQRDFESRFGNRKEFIKIFGRNYL